MKRYNNKILRIRRRGKIYYPVYEIILTNRFLRRDGYAYEKLGFINPNINERIFFINFDKFSNMLNKNVLINKSVLKYLIKFCNYFYFI